MLPFDNIVTIVEFHRRHCIVDDIVGQVVVVLYSILSGRCVELCARKCDACSEWKPVSDAGSHTKNSLQDSRPVPTSILGKRVLEIQMHCVVLNAN